jgi:hypothetical protein
LGGSGAGQARVQRRLVGWIEPLYCRVCCVASELLRWRYPELWLFSGWPSIPGMRGRSRYLTREMGCDSLLSKCCRPGLKGGISRIFYSTDTRAASGGGMAKFPAFFAPKGARDQLFGTVAHGCYFYPDGEWGGEG